VKKYQHADSRTGRSGNADPRQDLARPARTDRQGTQNLLNSGNAPRLPDHHDVEVMNEAGKVLAGRRLPEGVAGIAGLHALTGAHLGEDADGAGVVIGIETDRGPWVTALIAAGHQVYPVNPLQASRYRERLGVSRARSDAGDARMLAGMVRADSHQLRPAAGGSPEAEAVKVPARARKTLIWERTRAVQRLRHQLLGCFPAALEAFEDLDAPDTLELLGKAAGPARAARLTRAQVSAALKRARRRTSRTRPPPSSRRRAGSTWASPRS
jgi:transposase